MTPIHMSTYTVLYTCVRGYRSFRQVAASSEQAAAQYVRTSVGNVGEVTGVRPGL